MKFAHASTPSKPLAFPALFLSWALAGLLIIMATAQLMTYEKFVPLMQNYQLFGDYTLGRIIAALLVIGEVFSLPFLLRMNISPLFRLTSALSLVLVSALWLILGMWTLATHPPLVGLGIFGSLLKVDSSALLVAFVVGLLVLSGVVMWRLRDDFSFLR